MPTSPIQDPRQQQARPPFPKQEQAHPGHEAEMRPTPDHGELTYRGQGKLKDRVALVTGGDSGIGRAVALAFAREGADVAFSFVGPAEDEDARETERLVQEAGRRVYSHAAELSRESICRELVERVAVQFGRIDILVNNVAYQGKAVDRFEDLDGDRVERTFAVNIISFFHITRYALPYMKPGSVIINSASIQAFDPSPGILDYATTKAAIVAFTKGLAAELIGRGIRVNAVAPGPVWTPLVTQSFDTKKVSKFGEDSPMGRPAQPVEIAPAFVFLASDESRFVVGETIGITGGLRLV